MAWWTGAANEDLSVLEAAFSKCISDGPDPAEAARIGLRLAEYQLTRGDLGAAGQVLETMRPWLPDDLELRWRVLQNAVQAAIEIGPGSVLKQLRDRVSEASARGAKRLEALTRSALAGYLAGLEDADRRVEALDERCRARALFTEVGDHHAVLDMDDKLVAYPVSRTPDLVNEMIEHTEMMLRASEDPTVVSQAALILARLYRDRQRLQDAERMLDIVLSEQNILRGDLGRHVRALLLKAELASDRCDWQMAHTIETELILLATRIQLPALESGCRSMRAHSSMRMDKPVHACIDLLTATNIDLAIGRIGDTRENLDQASQIALSLSLPQIAAPLLLRAARAVLHELSAGTRDLPQLNTTELRTAGETALAERLDELNRWVTDLLPSLTGPARQQRLGEFGQQFQGLLDAREAQLRSQGIEVMDPLTWGISEEPPDP